jgi:Flp pilus assembly protein TadG
MARTRLRDDTGTMTILFAVVFAALLVMLGVVVDGGRVLDQRSHAHDVAAQAARAGAQRLAVSGFVADGNLHLDPGPAVTAAQSVLAAAGLHGHVDVTGTTVTVTVTDTVPLSWLRLVGLTAKTVSATATADARTTGAQG